jgi:hypothetical protein
MLQIILIRRLDTNKPTARAPLVRGLLLLLLLAVASIPGAHGGIYGFWKWFRGALAE